MAKRIELRERLTNDPKLKIDLDILDNILGIMESDALLESLDMFGVDNLEVDIILEMGYEFTGIVYVIQGPFKLPQDAKEIILDFLRQVDKPIMIYLKSTLEGQRDVVVAYESSVKLEGLEELYEGLVGEGEATIQFFILDDIQNESKDNCDYRLTAREGYRYQANNLLCITSINEDLAEEACEYIVRYLTDFDSTGNRRVNRPTFLTRGSIIATNVDCLEMDRKEFADELFNIVLKDKIVELAVDSRGVFCIESEDFLTELVEEIFSNNEKINQLEDLMKDFGVSDIIILATSWILGREIFELSEITADMNNWYTPNLNKSEKIVINTINLKRNDRAEGVDWV